MRVIRAVQFQTDRSEIIANAAPGRLLYKIGAVKAGTPPDLDTFAAASATYSIMIPLWFVDPLMLKPRTRSSTRGAITASCCA